MEKTRQWWREKLKGGLIPAVPVLLHKDGVIHRDAQQKYCEHMAQQDIRGVAVWVHTGAEKFERRTVRAQALSADSTAVTSGIAAGERVVTQGASLLAQVR